MLSFNRTYEIPFKYDIPCQTQLHLQQKNQYKRFIKFLKRYLYIILKGQKNREIFEILPDHKKILWINISAPSLGDSLMDLSSRIILTDKSVDLFTDKKNAHIYLNDQVFNNIYTKVTDVDRFKYDLVVIDSYSSRSIKIKSKIAPKTLYVGMFGYFNGPEVNRILFSFHQMNYLLGYFKSENEINNLARASISISRKDQEIVNNIIPDRYISIVLGGEWKHKTYKKWNKVVERIIFEDKALNIVFVGSENAQNVSKELLEKFPQNNFFNFVAKLSFNQTVEVIRRSQILLCCDGGLMHAANAINTNIVPLFARLTPKMLLTKNMSSYTLYDENDVNNIPVKDVLSKYYEASNLLGGNSKDEYFF